MNYYELNKECIKRFKPSFYKQFFNKKVRLSEKVVENIESISTKDGELAIKLIAEGKEHRLNSVYHPKEEARRWIEQYEFHNLKITVTMFGFGNGVFVNAIIEKLKDGDLLLIYEPSIDMFFHVLEHYDLTSIFKLNNVHLWVEGVNEEDFGVNLKGAISMANYKNQIHCYHPKYDNIFLESYKNYLKSVQEGYTFVGTNINTQKYFSKLFMVNSLKNLQFLKNSTTLNDIKAFIPNHAPAVLIAAGPSVEANIIHLKKMKGKAVLFAVDRILDYLLECGIEPDFVITVDPEKEIEYFSPREDITIPLICYTESNHNILKHHQGKKIMCSKSPFLDEFYKLTNKPIPTLLPSGSVALIGFSVCVDLGFKKIILVGQDLAYDGDKSHGGNTVENNLTQKDVLVEGINGEMIKSRTDWEIFITRYRDLIQAAPDVEVIDAKLKGAKIKGAINMALEEAVEKYCTEKIVWNKDVINESHTFNEDDYETIYNFLLRGKKDIELIRSKTNKAIELCNGIIRLYKRKTEDKEMIIKNTKKLQNINDYVAEKPIYSLLNMNITPMVSSEVSQIYQFGEDDKKNEIKVIDTAKVLYEATLDTIEYIKPLLEKTIKKFQEL